MSREDPLEGYRGREITKEEQLLMADIEGIVMDPDEQNKLQRGQIVDNFLKTLPGQFLIGKALEAQKELLGAIQDYPKTSAEEIWTKVISYRIACDGLIHLNRIMRDAQDVIRNMEEEEQQDQLVSEGE